MIRFSTILLSVLLFFSCSNKTVFEQKFLVEEDGWNLQDSLKYQFDTDDVKQNYNLLINLKYKKTYSYSNIFFFVDVIDPEKETLRDTIECVMAMPSGKWLGRNSGDYIEQQLVYRYKVNFPKEGQYQIILQHAMRDSLLKKVSSVGLELQEFVVK